MNTTKSAAPTRKWVAAQITAIIGLALMLLTGDAAVTDPEKVAIGTWLVQAATTYLVPNDDTPAGVPLKSRRNGQAGYGLVELAVGLLILVVALVLLLRVL